jgi:uncharacterized protein DUF11
MVGVTTGTGNCSVAAPNVAHCDIGTLAVGGETNVVLTAMAPSVPGAVSDTANISMLGPDSKPANNSVTVTVQPK